MWDVCNQTLTENWYSWVPGGSVKVFFDVLQFASRISGLGKTVCVLYKIYAQEVRQ